MSRDLNRIQARLHTLGLDPILKELYTGQLKREIELPFTSLKTAKTVMRLLYNWLVFYPIAKEKVSLRLNTSGLPILTLIPRGIPEQRGSKGSKI